MREDLIKHGGKEAQLRKVDDDFAHLFGSWFNRGFLVLRPIDWSSPADMLERIIRYEAVHEIQGWDDLRRRVQPSDRRCFGFFHPSLIDEPLIFVEVALTREIPASIQSLLAEERDDPAGQGGDDRRLLLDQQLPAGPARRLVRQFPDQAGGRGAVARAAGAADLRHPVAGAGLRRLARPGAGRPGGRRPRRASTSRRCRRCAMPGWHEDAAVAERLKPILLDLAATYYLRAKGGGGKPVDPVARFHLGNGARLERLDWLGDVSPKGLREAHGLMVNYLYDLRFIEANHEAFANDGTVVAAKAVLQHLPAIQPAPETVA